MSAYADLCAVVASDFARETPAPHVAVELWSSKAAKLTEPVVIDLLTEQAYKPEKVSSAVAGGRLRICR